MGYILFGSENNVSIFATFRIWNGTIEYSYDNKVWNIWHGEKIINNTIYMRGINNTVVSGGYNWIIKGDNIKCQGNIENLLDYKSVINNIHPKMDDYCFASMFECCSSLVETPQLLAIKLSKYCYARMFRGCKNILMAPKLSALQLSEGCYGQMFEDCQKLNQISPLLALELPHMCYVRMFGNCTSLTQAPSIMAIKVHSKCCAEMFANCFALTSPPSLYAMNMQHNCYIRMFARCKNLLQSPIFPNLQTAKKAIINQHAIDDCPISFVNINNKLYDINVLKLL